MKVLLIGNGAREHIIAEKIAADGELYAVMSQKNPGIAKLAKKHWICNIENPVEILRCITGEPIEKPIGLTGGKGVKVSGDHFSTIEEGMAYVREVLRKDGRVLIEEKVEGEEFSFQAFSDGTRTSFMPPVQDHKRAFENDLGPNTGGMGSYSTGKLLPFLEPSDIEQAQKIIKETIHAMKKDGRMFKGVLYGQFMATKDGLKVIEFNSRFGDPEAMNVLSLLRTSIVDMMLSIADEKIYAAEFEDFSTVVKYLVPDGYPEKPEANKEIKVDEAEIMSISSNSPKMVNAKFYYASVNELNGKIYTSNSRAVGVVGIGPTIEHAETTAELACKFVNGAIWHRKDIGTKALIDKRIEHMHKIRGKNNEK
ncbi:phosphoribosylamine--glycine ligase [Candidatus Micrarchaeota archaeon]|nr:phosphoribosylamine--glycine ligase [Candidatus Micrarchaeota archaeon]